MPKVTNDPFDRYCKLVATRDSESATTTEREVAAKRLVKLEEKHPGLRRRYEVEIIVQREMAAMRDRTGMPNADSITVPPQELRDSVFDFARGKFVNITGMDPVQWGIRQMERAVESQIRILAEEGEHIFTEKTDYEEILMTAFATLYEELQERVGVGEVFEDEDEDGSLYILVEAIEIPESLAKRLLADPKNSAEDVGRFFIDLLADAAESPED